MILFAELSHRPLGLQSQLAALQLQVQADHALHYNAQPEARLDTAAHLSAHIVQHVHEGHQHVVSVLRTAAHHLLWLNGKQISASDRHVYG